VTPIDVLGSYFVKFGMGNGKIVRCLPDKKD